MGTYTILAVDNQRSVLESLDILLDDWPGCNLLLADCAADAVALASRHRIDLILLDLIMPDVQGSELLKTLQRYCSKILVISAVRRRDAISELLATGIQGYIFKPFDIDALTSMIMKTLHGNGRAPAMRLPSPRLDNALAGWRICPE